MCPTRLTLFCASTMPRDFGDSFGLILSILICIQHCIKTFNIVGAQWLFQCFGLWVASVSKNGSWQALWLDLVGINMCAKIIKIFLKCQLSHSGLGIALVKETLHLAIYLSDSCQCKCVDKILSKYSIWLRT